jgi:hypothetical protein
VDTLNGDVKRLVGPVSEDLTLRSTLDLNLQSIAEGVIARRLKGEGHAKKVGQAALVAMAPDGAILAKAVSECDLAAKAASIVLRLPIADLNRSINHRHLGTGPLLEGGEIDKQLEQRASTGRMNQAISIL